MEALGNLGSNSLDTFGHYSDINILLTLIVLNKSIYCAERQSSYLIRARPENEEVERDRCKQIDRKPAFDIVLGYPARLCDHLVIVVHVCCAKVDDNIHDEQHIHH